MSPAMLPSDSPDDTGGLLAPPRPPAGPFPRAMPKLSPRLLVLGMEASEAGGRVMALGGEVAEELGWRRPEDMEVEEGFLGRCCCCVDGWGGCCVALL